jgi:hypothetical protein
MPPRIATTNKKAAYYCIRVAPPSELEAKRMSKRLSSVVCYDNGANATTNLFRVVKHFEALF